MVVTSLVLGCLAMLLTIALGLAFLHINDKFGKIVKEFEDIRKEFIDIRHKFRCIQSDTDKLSNRYTALDVWFGKLNGQVCGEIETIKKELEDIKRIVSYEHGKEVQESL